MYVYMYMYTGFRCMCLYMVWNLTFNNEILSPPSVISGIHNAAEPKNVFVIFFGYLATEMHPRYSVLLETER